MRDEAATERRLLQETRELIATINKGGLDCAKVEVTYGTESGNWPTDPDETHCGHFIVVCHKPEEWDEEAEGEPYSPYASSEALIRDWFEARPNYSDWWQIDDTYAC